MPDIVALLAVFRCTDCGCVTRTPLINSSFTFRAQASRIQGLAADRRMLVGRRKIRRHCGLRRCASPILCASVCRERVLAFDARLSTAKVAHSQVVPNMCGNVV